MEETDTKIGLPLEKMEVKGNSIHLNREFILNCVAEHYNINPDKTNLILSKEHPEYIQVTWDAQTE